MVNSPKEYELSKVNIYKIIEIFIENVESGNKILFWIHRGVVWKFFWVFYLLSIINKLYLLDLVILLFIVLF